MASRRALRHRRAGHSLRDAFHRCYRRGALRGYRRARDVRRIRRPGIGGESLGPRGRSSRGSGGSRGCPQGNPDSGKRGGSTGQVRGDVQRHRVRLHERVRALARGVSGAVRDSGDGGGLRRHRKVRLGRGLPRVQLEATAHVQVVQHQATLHSDEILSVGRHRGQVRGCHVAMRGPAGRGALRSIDRASMRVERRRRRGRVLLGPEAVRGDRAPAGVPHASRLRVLAVQEPVHIAQRPGRRQAGVSRQRRLRGAVHVLQRRLRHPRFLPELSADHRRRDRSVR
mmetsp:Transcript_13255/g.56021  ORF Transcript_13255/g.56021 Transcript_13255/m.56021 type:complete len:284 (+) Transcript_13255:106-957(+)